MSVRRSQYVTNLDNDYIDYTRNTSTNILDDDFKNLLEILIGESIGQIPKNYCSEYQRLSAYAFYPPLNKEQIRKLAVDNVTSTHVQNQISDNIFKQLSMAFRYKMFQWNPTDQTIARRFVENAVQQAVEIMRKRLTESINSESQATNVIIQRFILENNRLKII